MDNRTKLASIFHSSEHQPEVEDEAFPVFMPRGVRDIILDFFDNDIQPIQNITKKKNTVKQYADFTLFGRDLHYFMNCKSLAACANAILSGGEVNFLTVQSVVKDNPMLLRIPTIGIDPLNRCVKGTLIQIAAMAGDVNLTQGLSNEKELGLVERLQLIGKVSDEEVKDHLEVITGKDAKIANDKRNQLVLIALDKFLNAILKVESSNISEFKAFKQKCETHTLQFEKDLKAITCQPITSGYIFDPAVISQAAKKFEKKVKAFGGWFSFHTGVFWVNGFGMLQRHLSVRDSQVVLSGMSHYLKKHIIPSRLYDILSSKYPSVGHDVYVHDTGYCDSARSCSELASTNTQELKAFDRLVANKNKSIEALSNSKRSLWSYLRF